MLVGGVGCPPVVLVIPVGTGVVMRIVVFLVGLIGAGVTFSFKISPNDPPIGFLFFARRDTPTPIRRITTKSPTKSAKTLFVLSISVHSIT